MRVNLQLLDRCLTGDADFGLCVGDLFLFQRVTVRALLDRCLTRDRHQAGFGGMSPARVVQHALLGMLHLSAMQCKAEHATSGARYVSKLARSADTRQHVVRA